MRRISNVLFCGLLMAGLCLLWATPAQAQPRRLLAKQAKKLEKQTAASTGQTQEKSVATPTATGTQPVRQPGLQPANPRLQAIVLDRFLPRLDLTPEQQASIRSMRMQHVRRMRTLLEMERVHTRAYDEALFDLTLDQKEVEKRTAQLAETRTDLLNAQAKLFLELRRLLTPEQFTKLRQIMDEERAVKRNAP